MLQLFRTNPGLGISFALLGGGALVCTLLGLLMARSGASLRPIYWFAGFFALVLLPQLIGHYCIALQAAKAEAPRTAALAELDHRDSTESSLPANGAKSLFGPDVDPQLISDARETHGGLFHSAESAQFAVLPNGDTVLLARFNGSFAAEKAWIEYLRLSGLNQLKGEGDSQRGYVVTRLTGDRAYVLHSHNLVGVWTGANDEAIRKRMSAGGFEIPPRATLARSTPLSDAEARKAAATQLTSRLPIPLIAVSFALYALIVVLYFFKGAAWAGTSVAKPGSLPIRPSELTQRLEAINALDVPFRIERGTQPNEFFATWRYADARWIDFARAHQMKRTFRIRFTLDEARQTVRATDETASYEGSAGFGGAKVRWESGLGIVFFQSEYRRVFGLQLDDQGRFKPETSYAYRFNLNELKSPLVQAVTQSGWNWRPTIWQGPLWLRWLTE